MTAQIKAYLSYIEEYAATEHSREDNIAERKKLLNRIELYQHERLIHLMVTLAFALLFLISLGIFLTAGGVGVLILTALLLILLIPYIQHYYFLENSVQKLYTYYYNLELYIDD